MTPPTPATHIVCGTTRSAVEGAPSIQRAIPSIVAPYIFQTALVAPSPTRLEVGVLDSTLGWLRVRAEATNAGGIQASLITNPDSRDVLHAAIPQIANYLQSEGIAVSRLDLVTSDLPVASGSAMSGAFGNGNDSQSQQEHRSYQANQRGRAASPPSHDQGPVERPSAGALTATTNHWIYPTTLTGGWLSICA